MSVLAIALLVKVAAMLGFAWWVFTQARYRAPISEPAAVAPTGQAHSGAPNALAAVATPAVMTASALAAPALPVVVASQQSAPMAAPMNAAPPASAPASNGLNRADEIHYVDLHKSGFSLSLLVHRESKQVSRRLRCVDQSLVALLGDSASRAMDLGPVALQANFNLVVDQAVADAAVQIERLADLCHSPVKTGASLEPVLRISRTGEAAAASSTAGLGCAVPIVIDGKTVGTVELIGAGDAEMETDGLHLAAVQSAPADPSAARAGETQAELLFEQ